MNFVDPAFFIFFPCFILPYILFKGNLKLIWLLLASYIFYGYFSPAYCLLLLLSSLVDYLLGLKLGERNSAHLKKYIACSIVFNISLLCIFKYTSFIWNDLVIPSASSFGYEWEMIDATLPPVGISFFTFQTMSYAIDVYRGQLKPCHSPLKFFVYVSMFPQLVAGPIVRARDLLPQLQEKVSVSLDDIKSGLFRFCRGFIKKACIADSLGLLIVDNGFHHAAVNSPELLVLSMFCYGFQIYFDFSGYSDMAIGLGRLMGFRFPENFNYPYLSKSFSEFWTRWHISLSSWLRDYLYIPMGGNRRGQGRTLFNLTTTMLLGGLWHGPSLLFVLWGAMHGGLLVLQRCITFILPERWLRTIPAFIKIACTWFCVTLCWVPFRAKDMETVYTFWKAPLNVDWLNYPFWILAQEWNILLLLVICVASHFLIQPLKKISVFAHWPIEMKTLYAGTVLFWCLHFFPNISTVQPFIYFQF